MIKFPFKEVEGYLSPEDRVSLKMLAERQSNVFGSFAEIGSYKGLSALCIMAGAKPEKFLHCFDFFEPDKFCEFGLNTESYWNRIIPHAGDFKKSSIDPTALFAFVFADHSHTLEDTAAAYKIFWPLLSKGGVFAVHDYSHPDYQEPREYLDSLPHKRLLEGSILALLKE